MLIELELNRNDAESLLRHCVDHQPNSGDFREDARLSEALLTLSTAIKDSMSAMPSGGEPMPVINPELLEAATKLFGDKELAIGWLSKPLRALGDESPINVHTDVALTLIMRLEHGFCS
ncbi:MbcA/ParS/Xre antitoxin family protein [Pseudomonas silvicola]|nr:MbcA/ParS/Xre antitoxin family protein [Pseudomonas silvicola]